jgi:FkbM family methyltransferase
MDPSKYIPGSGVFVQIGAGAGDKDPRANYRDGFSEYVKALPTDLVKKVILVEPNPMNISALRECWSAYPQSEIYQLGIVPSTVSPCAMVFYYCPFDAPHYQVASLKPEHVIKHYGEHCPLGTFTVPVVPLNTFLHDHVPGSIDLLSMDIEGIDAEILLDMDLATLRVNQLSFEHLHLGPYAKAIEERLTHHGFTFLGTGVDHNGFDHLYERR